MLPSVSIPSEKLRCEAVRFVGLSWSWNERDVFHLFEHTLVRHAVPMAINRICLQILLVAGLSDGSKHARFFGGFYVGAVTVVSRQIVIHHMAHLWSADASNKISGCCSRKRAL